MNKTIIIAEAGVNHNGDINLAKKMIDVAHDAGVDYVKFQTFIPSEIVSKFAKKAEYQKANAPSSNDSQLAMLEQLKLSEQDHYTLIDYCKSVGIKFLSTPFDFPSIDFLSTLNLDFWKVPSGDITNLPYLLKIGKTGMDVVLSTGMSNMDEIAFAIDTLLSAGAGKITLLHCNTQYPTPLSDVNLNAMSTLRQKFNLPVGYSDHTQGIEVAIGAVALGATIIEKHFTLDKNMPGPDHKASLNPQELKEMVQDIHNLDLALGTFNKLPTASESGNKSVARKSIVAKVDIKKGDLLCEDNITVKRPGQGISPMQWFDVLGSRAKKDFWEDELIEL